MRGAAFLIIACLFAAGFTCDEQTPRTFGTPGAWTTLKSDEIDESSGIAPSQKEKGAYWTHNDDGATLDVYRFRQAGDVTKWTVPGVTNRDCEDMASATIGGKSYLYVADIGDNGSVWHSVRIYRFEEPTEAGKPITKVDVIEAKYPDGAHNAEAFMVDSKTGAFWIVEKRSDKKSGIFRLEAPKPGSTNTFERVGEIELGGAISGSKLITGGAISQDRQFVILRTYLAAYEFPAGDMGAWWKTKPTNVKTALEGQGEAITYALDGKTILTTSEGKPCRVSSIPVN